MVLDFTKLTHQSGLIQFSANAMWCKLLGEQLGNTAYHWLSTMFDQDTAERKSGENK